MLDDPRKPFDELLTPKNVYDRVSALETKQTEPSAKVGSNEELANTTGTQVVGNLLSPAPGVESTDPTDSAFTGSFMSGDGYAFNNEAYNMGGVNAGTLQWGAKQDDGTLVAGAGNVKLDENGITIITGPSAGEGDKLKFKYHSTGDMTHASIQLTTASTDSAYLETEVGSTDYIFSRNRVRAHSIYGSAEFKMQSDSDNVVTDIGLNGLTGILRVDHLNNTVSINNGAAISILDSASFTPTVFGATTAGVGTYTTQLGAYYVIGKMVFFEITMIWTAHTGTGNFRVGGLPFTAANNGISVPVTVTWSNITLAAVGNKLLASVNPNTTNISLFEIGSGAIANLTIDTAATLSLSGMYIAA